MAYSNNAKDGREYSAGWRRKQELERRQQGGENRATGAEEGVIFKKFIKNGAGAEYKAGEVVQDGSHGDIKLYTSNSMVREIDRSTFNRYADHYEKKEKQVNMLAEKFYLAGDILFIKFMGEYNYKLLGANQGRVELTERLKHDGYSDAEMIPDLMLNADARPSVLRMIDPKESTYAYGMLKLKNIIRTSDFIFNTDVEDDLIESNTDNLYGNQPSAKTVEGKAYTNAKKAGEVTV